MTDAVLRARSSSSYITIVNVLAREVVGVSEDLLDGETDGLAIDFTAASPQVQVRTAGVDAYYDPDTFFSYGGDPKYVKDSATTIAQLAFPISYGEGLLIEPAATTPFTVQ